MLQLLIIKHILTTWVLSRKNIFSHLIFLAEAWSPTPDLSILVVYSCFNQSKWASPLVNSLQKLNSVVERRTSKEQALHVAFSNKKQMKSKSDLVNEAAEFQRFSVFESLKRNA